MRWINFFDISGGIEIIYNLPRSAYDKFKDILFNDLLDPLNIQFSPALEGEVYVYNNNAKTFLSS